MNAFQPQQRSRVMPQRYVYSGKLLATLVIASVISILLIFGSGISSLLTMLSFSIYLLVISIIMVKDWRGFLTMNGALKWRSMGDQQRTMVRFLFVVFNVVFLEVYLAQAYLTYRHDRQLEPLKRKRKIAEQEAELGIMPHTDGTCGKCNQPLQVGAEFCVFCGARAMPRPRICPECFATALPDARWCPECGAQLQRDDFPSLDAS
jgi:rubredoxin